MEDPDVRELSDSMEPIWEQAKEFGLDPFPVHFELVPPAIMYEFGSYGLPGRFSHWSHGKVYHRMKTSYDYGLSKIYELVINTDPSYAFLMEGNSLLQNKLVMAHVLGHCDFFKHNAYFARTNRRMVETASLNAERIRRYEYEHGLATVERFLDAVLSIQDHLDPQGHFSKAQSETSEPKVNRPVDPATNFDDLFGLTPEDTDKLGEANLQTAASPNNHLPAQPEKDIVGFIMEHSRHLEPWQRDVMGIVRAEMLYFVPQMQTKICNEGWACATGDSLVLTERGYVRFDELYTAGEKIRVAAGGAGELCPISDFHREVDVPTLRVRTRRGLTIEGAHKHRILMADGTWAYLRDVKVGDRVAIECGSDVWPEAEQPMEIALAPVRQQTLETVAAGAGVSSPSALHSIKVYATEHASHADGAVVTTAYKTGEAARVIAADAPVRLPETLTPELAWLLGYLTAEGNWTESGASLTCADTELVGRLATTIGGATGLSPSLDWDQMESGGRWRVAVHSGELLEWLASASIGPHEKAPSEEIPRVVLQSPKPVMSAFLRGYFDARGYVETGGAIVASASEAIISRIQVILLNYGILSVQSPQSGGSIELHIEGRSAARFLDEIGSSSHSKQEALREYIASCEWAEPEDLGNTIVSIEHGHQDVYDISVDTKHSYIANGFINHNSFWHTRILRELDLTDRDVVEFAQLNAGVIAPSRHHINPYYLGVKMLEDIERRWESPSEEERAKFGRPGGEGRKKLFEVREEENDVSLIRNYMTRDLVDELDLYLYERQGDQWVIVDKNWENVRDGIVARMANFGNPTILVEDGDYHHNGELFLRHVYDGNELDVTYAEKTMEHIHTLWGRTVHLATMMEGEENILAYDGNKHTRNDI